MGKNTVDVTDASFSTDVLESDKTVLVDFWAEWCGPCKMVAPVLDEIAGENKDTITVAKVDIDRNPDAMRKYGIMAVPTLMVFQEGRGGQGDPRRQAEGRAAPRPRRLPGLNSGLRYRGYETGDCAGPSGPLCGPGLVPRPVGPTTGADRCTG